jgi:hypothetical protein
MFGNAYSISRISLQSAKHSGLRKKSPSTQPQESPEQNSTHSNEAFEQEQSSVHYRRLCDEI